MNSTKVKFGDVVFVNFGDFDGTHVQKGFRPAIILTNARILEFSNSNIVQVVPITSSNKLKKVHIKLEDAVFSKDSYALPEQVTTIDKSQIINIRGNLSSESMNKVKRAVYRQLGLCLKED